MEIPIEIWQIDLDGSYIMGRLTWFNTSFLKRVEVRLRPIERGAVQRLRRALTGSLSVFKDLQFSPTQPNNFCLEPKPAIGYRQVFSNPLELLNRSLKLQLHFKLGIHGLI